MNTNTHPFECTIVDSGDFTSFNIKFSGFEYSLSELYMTLEEINTGMDMTLPSRKMEEFFIKHKILDCKGSARGIGSVKGPRFNEFFNIVKSEYEKDKFYAST